MINIEQYLNDFFRGTKDTSLSSVQYFLNEYDNFHNKMKFIHIAGTNGKGSCVEMINNILITQGYKVGKFISPHLIKYNERISVNSKEITDLEMSDLIEELHPKIQKYNETHKINVTVFELITIIALIYFYRKNVDFVVLETGLGGLYDCTNIITNSLVSVITSIGYDHMRILGDTLPQIAYQKAGIIKPKFNTVFFQQIPDVNQVFIDVCKEKSNKLHLINNKIENYRYDDKYQYFDYENLKDVQIILKGKKQVQNAMLCIECMKILNDLGYKVSEESIRIGLKTVIHKARMEILNEKPLVIYDGAHNPPAIENLQDMVKMYYNNIKRIYVVNILKRKDYEKMLQILLQDKNAEFILTSGDNTSIYTSSEELYNIAIKYSEKQKIHTKTLDEALEYIMTECEDKANFIVGSFYTYGYVIKKIQKERK